MNFNTEQNNESGSNFGGGLVEFSQKVGIVVGGFSLVFGTLYFAFVKTPINNLNGRIEKLEIKLEAFTEIQRDIAVMKTNQQFITTTITDIKRELEKNDR